MTLSRLQLFLNESISDSIGIRRVAGDMFGVEIECEGRNVTLDPNNNNILKDWAPHRDGSLRDHHGEPCEWVFNGPSRYAKSVERIDALFDYFEKRKAKIVCSNRTSVHVHYNMSDKQVYQFVNMFILFTVLEGLFDKFCGEDRTGNLFCLSSRYANAQIDAIETCCFEAYGFHNINNNMRYSAFNFAALKKFGTVEFRGMRGLDNREDLKIWLSILNEFCEFACYKMRNPVNLIEDVSNKGALGILRDIFSAENVDHLTRGWDEFQVSESVYEGLRLVQMIAYRIGTEFDQVKLRGKDFWAELGKEVAEPVLDVQPQDILNQQPFQANRGDPVAILGAFNRARMRNMRIDVPVQPRDAMEARWVLEAQAAAPIEDDI